VRDKKADDSNKADQGNSSDKQFPHETWENNREQYQNQNNDDGRKHRIAVLVGEGWITP
jgi:hypothetical protein